MGCELEDLPSTLSNRLSTTVLLSTKLALCYEETSGQTTKVKWVNKLKHKFHLLDCCCVNHISWLSSEEEVKEKEGNKWSLANVIREEEGILNCILVLFYRETPVTIEPQKINNENVLHHFHFVPFFPSLIHQRLHSELSLSRGKCSTLTVMISVFYGDQHTTLTPRPRCPRKAVCNGCVAQMLRCGSLSSWSLPSLTISHDDDVIFL